MCAIHVLQATVSTELGISMEEANQRLLKVIVLLPGLLSRLPSIKAGIVVELCADTKVRFQLPKTLECTYPVSYGINTWIMGILRALGLTLRRLLQSV
jgi:hypothetical protein